MMKPEIVLEGLAFPEGPRWREGRLFFSDMHADEVVAMTPEGGREQVARVPEQPSGLGWLPDGRMLIVSMKDRKLLVTGDGGRLAEHADLSGVATSLCNDMVVDAQGRAYVGNFGSELEPDVERVPADLALVQPDGEVSVAAENMAFPNGSVITPDGRTLIVAETFAMALTAFDVAEDGSLSGRRTHAQLEGLFPDGICLDAEGGVWVASAVGHKVVRVGAGGRPTHEIPIETEAFACMLGDEDRRTLYICTAASSRPDICRASRTGRIEKVRVDVPGAGLP